MAARSVPIAPPEKFDFKRPDEWLKWRRRFDQFLSASGLDKEDESRRVSTLLYCLGEDAEDVLASTHIEDDDQKVYSKVIAKFDEHFKIRRNVIFERARFNKRSQLDGESVEEYITTLYSLIETCNYGELKDEMLRDRLIVGIRDAKLSENLQMDAELTLEKAKKKIRQKEAVQEQNLQLHAADQKVMEEVRKPPRPQYRSKSGPNHYVSSHVPRDKKFPPKGQSNHKCTRCGQARHKGDKCPAKSAECHRCHRKGHYSSQCFSKTVAASANSMESQQDSAFLGSVSADNETSWTTTLRVAGGRIDFKLDTGAEVTAISEKTYRTLGRLKLQQPSRPLLGPVGQSLTVLGHFTKKIAYRKKSARQTIFVVRGLRNNLLGFPAIKSLRLLKKVESMTTLKTMRERFANVFQGLGTLGEEYHIQLKPDSTPYSLCTPRNVPFPLRDKVKEELTRMESMGVISKVDIPTPWCAGMVVVPKKTGAVRICVDLKPLNESVLREVHPIPKVDEILGKLSGATIFSKLDANSGFWQIPLSEDSRLLTTFITPVGRFCFNKLPFGISSAPELFQKRMGKLLEGLEGVVCLIDDVLVVGADQKQHDERLTRVLERIESAGVTLNPEKCEFSKSSVRFLGHCIDKDGVRADPEKTAAICSMQPPRSVSELRRFMGMINQMGKFSPNIAEISKPLRELLSVKRAWCWGPDQERSFNELKQELTKPTILALYNPKAKSKVSADASSFGLGAVLLQKSENGEWRPVAYASRSLSETEIRYAQIEKEALAIVWSCEKFSDYILGSRFDIETDHKPLVPLLSSKRLDNLPPRVLRFRLRMAKYDYSISHVPGKFLYTADTLSRDPMMKQDQGNFEKEVETFVDAVIDLSLPVTPQRLQIYREAQEKDEVCVQVREYCKIGWPNKSFIPHQLIPYWKERDALTVCKGLLLFNSRIVVPKSLQQETLQKVHTGHLGIEKCKKRIAMSVWWPGVTQQVTQLVQNCRECAKQCRQGKEPLMPSSLPLYPWQVAGTDLFEWDNSSYLLVVDYFSRYPEVRKMSSTTSESIISALKSVFARHGIPEVLRSDNGPQYTSREFKTFASSYDFQQITSSPRFPQSNGQAERSVQTIKNLLKKADDPYMALLSYRATPLSWCNLSPAELCMGRRLRTSVPQTDSMLVPQWSYLQKFKESEKQYKAKQKENFDNKHRVKELPPISNDTEVWITTEKEPVPGVVVSPADRPRSYVVETPTGQIERNRSQLRVVPERSENSETSEQDNAPQESESPLPKQIMTRSKTGIPLRPPERLW